jgi:large subunit ribosomal protein L6
MSRIGNKTISGPAGVTVELKGQTVTVRGPKGELSWTLPAGISLEQADSVITISRRSDNKEERSLHGLSRSLVANMVEGVTNGYSKILELEGVGFRATAKGNGISMAVGYSSPVLYDPPEGVTITLENDTTIVVSGADKQAVGNSAARIRAFAPAEPYKGKGVKYRGEKIRRKAGKTVG